MTMIDDQPTTAREIHHPDWCRRTPHFCNVFPRGSGLVGDHYAPPTTINTHYGPVLWVGLMASADDENNARIALRIPDICDDDSHPAECEGHYTFAGTAHLEPEEALMLARRLTEAVADWHAARRDHPTSR